ncbi:MAG: tRNA (adenosine(37)-N6)-threonylcarbamoyltransferase complex ATPase subunit type 1 TsaE [Deltaproteobacteria bacterium CG11_big_fil_rev_8_21_14_0_20_45_16]|nr:MAG: tRNA (adenosine(37)-N6)-threonylcarbamoyltransferase complex ATPase subunit type 1 TsaE [Deltaproteobacteria bacterium CG11_big_fil_rev_8_21_14_0_20_45_16]
MRISTLEDWDKVAEILAPHLCKGVRISLRGPLGAGKTSLVRALLRHLGYEEHVASPSYPLVIRYDLSHAGFTHIDAFRLNEKDEIPWDWDELRSDIVAIEWPENLKRTALKFDIDVEIFQIDGSDRRDVRIEIHGKEII